MNSVSQRAILTGLTGARDTISPAVASVPLDEFDRPRDLFPDELYLIKEAQRELKCSHAHLYRLINSGKLEARNVAGKTCISGASMRRLWANSPRIRRDGSAA